MTRKGDLREIAVQLVREVYTSNHEEAIARVFAFAQAVQEECAKVADEHETTAREYAEEHNDKDSMLIRANEAQTIAQAIRARGGKL